MYLTRTLFRNDHVSPMIEYGHACIRYASETYAASETTA